jgi:glycosyltransferase involved in cell wall biosynthesis
MPLTFSVITCTWNSVKFLPASIASVLAQDYLNIEYVFVDGGSNDGTLDLIQSIPRPVTLVSGVNGGISAAMNKGIELATGDVIAHLHSDDYYLHSRVVSQVARVLEESTEEWCFGRAKDDVDGEVKSESWKVPRYSYQRLLKGNFIPHVSTFVRKRIFDRLGLFETQYRYAMDYDMWLRIGKHYNPIQLDDHLGVFRRHQNSTSTANQMEGLLENFRICMRHEVKTPWSYVYHYAHFLVRKRRLQQRLSKTLG